MRPVYFSVEQDDPLSSIKPLRSLVAFISVTISIVRRVRLFDLDILLVESNTVRNLEIVNTASTTMYT